MKNYILFIVSAFTIAFTSCTSSEDIEIIDIQSKYQAVFKVNPSTVVEPFTWQYEPGELSTIPSESKLRVRALIYDNTGKLVHEEVEQFTNYNVLMDFTIELEKGNYTVIAISDVINPNDNEVPEYWKLSEHSQLNETKLTSTGRMGGENKILGISSQSISVSSNNNEYKIDIKPAGAVVYTFYYNIHHYSDIKRYQLEMTQTVDEGIFDLNGSLNCTLKNNNNSYDWRMNLIYAQLYYYLEHIYSISYILPQNDLRLRFAAYTYTGEDDDPSGENYWLGKEMHIPTVKAGEQYKVVIDIADDMNGYSVDCSNITGSQYHKFIPTSASVQQKVARTNNVLYFQDVK